VNGNFTVPCISVNDIELGDKNSSSSIDVDQKKVEALESKQEQINSIEQSGSKGIFNRSSESSFSSSVPESSLTKSLAVEVPSIKKAFEEDTKIRQFLDQLAPQQMLDKTEI